MRFGLLHFYTLSIAAILAIASTEVFAQQGEVISSPTPKDVSVLYLVDSRTTADNYLDAEKDRLKRQDTQAFLEKHFSKVGVYDQSKYISSDDMERASKDYDVIVIDWKGFFNEDITEVVNKIVDPSWRDPWAPNTYEKFERSLHSFPTTKPMVIMGKSVTFMMTDDESSIQEGLQWMPWRTSFIGNYAYGTDATHPIFNGPLKVAMYLIEIEKPWQYFVYPGTREIGESMPVWKIQHQASPRRGVCCPRRYFDKSDDAEVITLGTADAPDSVMIGRHGNLLVWGFSANPNEMTAAGQAVFVNAICYMKQFDGKLPGRVHEVKDPRHEFLESIYLMRASTNKYATAYGKEIERLFRYAPNARRREEPIYFAKLFQKSGQEYLAQRMKTLPRDISDPFDGDVEKIVSYYTDNYEYLYLDPRHRYVVDEEAKSLGLNVRSPEFLQRCIDLLDSSKDTESALVLLRRYAGKVAETPEQWRAWYESDGKTWVFDELTTKFQAASETDKRAP